MNFDDRDKHDFPLLRHPLDAEKAPLCPESQRVTISQAIDEYLDFIKAHRKKRTYVTYRYTLDKLLKQWCRRSYRAPPSPSAVRNVLHSLNT